VAIRLQKGLVGAYGQLGKLAGEAKAEQQKAERLERAAERLQQMQLSREKMMLNRQWDIEAYNRSKQWELEKMEIASRLDFQNQEERRQRDSEELEAKKKAIRESQILGNKEKQLWITQLESGLPVATSGQNRPMTAEQRVKALEAQALEPFWEEQLQRLQNQPSLMRPQPAQTNIAQQTGGISQPKNLAEYQALSAGSTYRDPSGNIRTKK